ncbi:uncharacterized protein LOC118744673 isoform X2 [Rhagoletis pomonella]|uniref:uncharacterized protein LOC118744673 isoform X2 n=1 Tax=Rhagoletis pomonella TaxID=28610 RepID=UPI00177DA828|nr:uncharacterized protein LOC118744673 isoform X2 [Rhagoletis pomonella]
MEPPPTKKPKMDVASSGVIILNPAGAPGKKVADSKFIHSNPKNTGAPASLRILPKLAHTTIIKKSVQPIAARSVTLSTPTIQLDKPVATGRESLLKQQNQLTQQNTLKTTTTTLLQQPPVKLTTQQQLPKPFTIQTNNSIRPNTQNSTLKQTILPSKAYKWQTTQEYLMAKRQSTANGLTQQNNPAKLATNQQITKPLNIQAKNYTPQISMTSVPKPRKLLPKPQVPTATLQTNVTPQQRSEPQFQYIEFINEALFDYEETNKKQVISVSDSEDNTAEIEEKTLEYLLQKRKTPSIDLETETRHAECVSKCVQTDQPDDDRVYCGFVNVTKDGSDKYFNLRCFYCDAEYPISFYSDFSDHINENHGNLEKVHVNENHGNLEMFHVENDDKNTTNEMVFSDFSDSSDDMPQEDSQHRKLFINLIDTGAKETYIPSMKNKKELLPEDFDDGEEPETGSESESNYMCVEKYDPNIDHCYSQSGSNKFKFKSDAQPVDEIIFGKTSREIVLDFLDHLKGFSCLWRHRDLAPVNYDNELLDLMDILVDKWGLNLKIRPFRKNLENIKSWYIGMTISKEEMGEKFNEHTYIDFYKKCAEYLPVGNTSKQHKIHCNLCDRFCFDMIGLQMHKYRKHKIGQLPHGCSKCDKRFDYVHKLRRHILKNHTIIPVPIRKYVPPKPAPPPEPDTKCFECNTDFPNSEEYKRHLEIHPRGDCPYACEECGRRFKTVSVRNSHKKRHQEPSFQCLLCPRKFFFAYHLQQHISCHKGDPNYICELCGKTFIRQKLFKEHVDYVHLGRGYCKICDRHYHKRSILHKHLCNVHRPVIGSVDDLAKRRRQMLREPGSRKGLGAGPRPQTRKYTYLTDPVTQKRRIACPKCDKSYYQYDSLYAHAKKVHGSLPGYLERPTGNQKTTNRKRKRGGKKIDDMEDEAASAVNAITTRSAIKLDDSAIDHNNPVDPNSSGITEPNKSPVANNYSAPESEIKVERNMTTMSFEKFVDEIAMGSNFVPSSLPNLNEQSPVKNEAAPCVKSEEFEVNDYEFMLNGSSVLNF